MSEERYADQGVTKRQASDGWVVPEAAAPPTSTNFK